MNETIGEAITSDFEYRLRQSGPIALFSELEMTDIQSNAYKFDVDDGASTTSHVVTFEKFQADINVFEDDIGEECTELVSYIADYYIDEFEGTVTNTFTDVPIDAVEDVYKTFQENVGRPDVMLFPETVLNDDEENSDFVDSYSHLDVDIYVDVLADNLLVSSGLTGYNCTRTPPSTNFYVDGDGDMTAQLYTRMSPIVIQENEGAIFK